MTLQAVQAGVINERNAAMRALAYLTAIAAHHERRQPSAIQEQDRLLLARQRSADRDLQLAAQGTSVLRGDLFTHIDDRDRGQGTTLGAMGQLEQVLTALERRRVANHARRGTTEDHHRLGAPAQPAGNRGRMVPRNALLFEGG